MKTSTKAIHYSYQKPDAYGALSMPIYHTCAYEFPDAEIMADAFCGRVELPDYTRVTNPTVIYFEKKAKALTGATSSFAFCSGMAAITNALLNIVGSGDEIITSTSLYGGTIDLFHDLEAFGIRTIFVDATDMQTVENAITDRTRALFAETIGNPKLDVTDIPAWAEIAKKHQIPLIIDNTVATAFLVQPLTLGADVVINSTSKYINGNSSAISGVITDGGRFKWDVSRYPGMKDYVKFGRFAFTAKLRNGLFRNMGACMAPQTAYYNLLGMETLGLRMERACDNAAQLAAYLEEIPGITVNYPGLESSPWHAVADRLLDGRYGAILTIRVGSKDRAFSIMNTVKIPQIVSNIGDTKTLIVHPESTLAAHSTEQEKLDAAVYDDMIRISVGIEDIEDLKADFASAISSTAE